MAHTSNEPEHVQQHFMGPGHRSKASCADLGAQGKSRSPTGAGKDFRHLFGCDPPAFWWTAILFPPGHWKP
jgi:hypothetical protein